MPSNLSVSYIGSVSGINTFRTYFTDFLPVYETMHCFNATNKPFFLVAAFIVALGVFLFVNYQQNATVRQGLRSATKQIYLATTAATAAKRPVT
jgi:quinol-cytochrome oxidoreductase complex cytochrome b subunit